MKSLLSILIAMAWSLQTSAADAPSRALTPTDLNMLARVSDPQVSPDGRYVVYVQRETDLEANRGRTDLWLLDLATPKAKPRRITQHVSNDAHPRWQADSSSVYFLSSRTGSQQVWRLPLAGGEAVQITDYPLDVGSFRFSLDGARIALSMEMFPDCADPRCTRDRVDAAGKKKGSGRVYNSLFIRHWDTWNAGQRSNLFVASLGADGRAGSPVWIVGGAP